MSIRVEYLVRKKYLAVIFPSVSWGQMEWAFNEIVFHVYFVASQLWQSLHSSLKFVFEYRKPHDIRGREIFKLCSRWDLNIRTFVGVGGVGRMKGKEIIATRIKMYLLRTMKIFQTFRFNFEIEILEICELLLLFIFLKFVLFMWTKKIVNYVWGRIWQLKKNHFHSLLLIMCSSIK